MFFFGYFYPETLRKGSNLTSILVKRVETTNKLKFEPKVGYIYENTRVMKKNI